ncbi:ESX secretion-associated protein EspG [Actinomycetospora callitridis]|uniref:ESX secretion-associated protein EspG n=1 Tax=Actinomycetospora callitridis TaxID=913944 RepID=UPI002365E41B|nr:ESX secretion-associated protein EspG [Actinomycetospora callitridis]MDD7919653.1 ESX secretion-associated protein EspG [Actinomycetospora callitridis]
MTIGIRGGVHLDVGQYLALWRHLGLGEHPLLLSVLDHGRTYAERDALDAAARDRLAAHGLLEDPSLADMLSVLATPAREVDVRVLAEGAPPLDVLAATRGALGVVAWLVPGGLRLDAADPDDLAGALLARLPDRPAASGVPMSLPADALLGDGVTLDERARRLRRAGVSAHHVERLRAIWATPPERSVTFGVAVRDAAGVRRRGPRVVTVLDTATGRLAMGPDASGSRIVVRPTDRPRLRAELAALLEGHERDVAASSRRR